MNRWRLSAVRWAGDDTYIEFKREVPPDARRGSLDGATGKKWEYNALTIDKRGRVHLYKLGQKQSAKGALAKRRHALAHQASGYWHMVGGAEGFPEQDDI